MEDTLLVGARHYKKEKDRRMQFGISLWAIRKHVLAGGRSSEELIRTVVQPPPFEVCESQLHKAMKLVLCG